MSRSPNHPQVRMIMSAMDLAIASPWATEDGIVQCVASVIVELGNQADYFEYGPGLPGYRWTVNGLRAIVLAYALEAPPGVLRAMAEQARKQLAWVKWWDRKGHIEARTVPRSRAA